MKNMFSAGELAKLQKISKQTLLFYDKTGLFRPAYTDPENGYRYYSAEQLDYLDTILIMKKTGVPLKKIREYMETGTTENSLHFLRNQISVIEEEIKELKLVESRLKHRCHQVENSLENISTEPERATAENLYILYEQVEKPYSMKETSIATKKCYAKALSENLPVYYQCGVTVPLEKIKEGNFMEANTAFVVTENVEGVKNIRLLPEGKTISMYHYGNYYNIGNTYKKILDYCNKKGIRIISDSYEFCINDYITSKDEEEFITKIMFYIED